MDNHSIPDDNSSSNSDPTSSQSNLENEFIRAVLTGPHPFRFLDNASFTFTSSSGIGFHTPPVSSELFRVGLDLLRHFVEAGIRAAGESRGPPPAQDGILDRLPKSGISEEEVACKMSCPVCFEAFDLGVHADKGLRVDRLPCNHCFHRKCIEPWVKTHNTCPVCRYELPTGDQEFEIGRVSRMRPRGLSENFTNPNPTPDTSDTSDTVKDVSEKAVKNSNTTSEATGNTNVQRSVQRRSASSVRVPNLRRTRNNSISFRRSRRLNTQNRTRIHKPIQTNRAQQQQQDKVCSTRRWAAQRARRASRAKSRYENTKQDTSQIPKTNVVVVKNTRQLLDQFSVGQSCRVVGLQKKGIQYNGREGVIIGLDEKRGRYKVKILNEDCIKKTVGKTNNIPRQKVILVRPGHISTINENIAAVSTCVEKTSTSANEELCTSNTGKKRKHENI